MAKKNPKPTPTHKFQIMPLQVAPNPRSATGNSNLTLTNAAHCSHTTSLNTFVGQHNTIKASIVGNLAKVFRPGPEDECTTPYLCHKKCKCEQISTAEPAEMTIKHKDDDMQTNIFTKLGEVCTGVTMYYSTPALVATLSLKATAAGSYAFLDGSSVTAGDSFIILPQVGSNDDGRLVRTVLRWTNYCHRKGLQVKHIPQKAYPLVCGGQNTFNLKMLAGSSVLHSQDSFTTSLFTSLVCDVDTINPMKRVQALQKTLSDYLVAMLSGANQSQRVTLSAFKTPCRSLPNRAALFQQLTLEIRPQPLSNYTFNELFLTGHEYGTRNRLGKLVQPDLLVSSAQLDSIINVTPRFQNLPKMSREALMNAIGLNELDDLVAVLGTIAVEPSDDTDMAMSIGPISIDGTTTLMVDGVEQPLTDVGSVGTVLHPNRHILFDPAFIKGIYSSLVDSTSIIFTHEAVSFDLKQLSFFEHSHMGTHMADLDASLSGYSDINDSLISLTGASVLELDENFNPTGVMVASSEVFISEPSVIAELEAARETIVSDISTSSVQVSARDLDVHNTVSINYTATKPIMFMLLVATCDALFTDVYGNASGHVTGLDFKSDDDRKTIFGSPAFPGNYLIDYNISGVEQASRPLKMGDTFTRGFKTDNEILVHTTLKLNGVSGHEITTMSAAGRNPVALNGFYNKQALDISRGSVDLEFTGVYLLTFTSRPFGMIDEPFEHDCFSNFVNVVRIESVELILKFNPDFFGLYPSVVVQVDCFAAVPNIKRQMSGLMGNLLANDTC